MEVFDLKIGFKCNNNCVHCVVADKRESGSLNVPTLCKLVEEVPAGYAIQITGGEPSICSYLPTILKKCKDCNHETIVQTNGTGFSDLEFAKECAPYIDHAHVAIHSCIEEVHDGIVGSKGMWEKTMQGFKNLLDLDVYCTTQTVLSKYNIESLYDTFKYIQTLKPGTRMSMTYPHMMGNAYHNRQLVYFRYIDYKDMIRKVLKEFHDTIFVEAIPPCYLYPYHEDVETAEKDIIRGLFEMRHGISSSRIGVDFSNGFDRKNYNQLDLESHRKGPKCKECILNKECLGVWKEYIELFKDKLDLIPIEENI